MNGRTSTSSTGLAFLIVLVGLLVSLPAPAIADHRPKHVPDAEEPPVVTEEVTTVDGITVVADQVATVEGTLAQNDKKKEPADHDVVASTAERKEDKLRVGKDEKGKLKVPGPAKADAADSSGACAEGACHANQTKDQQTSIGVVPGSFGTAEVIAPSMSLDPGSREEKGVTNARQVLSAGDRKTSRASAGRSLGGAAIVAASQPSLAITVNALNDADGDGIFSDSETASVAGADISFKAIITNMASTAFEIAGVSQSFTSRSGRVQIDVCADLDGLTVGFGESLACSFSVEGYSPPLGKSVVNTVTASAIEVTGSGRRGTSDSDNTTVSTLLGDQVLAVAIERADPLAFTGTEAGRLLALAFMLLAVGAALLHASRTRAALPRRPVIWVGPRFRVAPPDTASREPRPTARPAR